MDPQRPHIPVLAEEVVRIADVGPGVVVVDGTFGAGGHAHLLAASMDGRGVYVAIDRDPSAAARVDAFSARWPGIDARFEHDTFPHAFDRLVGEGVSCDVVILDVGVSSMQLDEVERGFAYSMDAPLDMRMDPTVGISARDIVNDMPQRDLARVIREYGEERFAGRIARAICTRRETQPIERTGELADIIAGAIPAPARRTGGHPAKRTFQALRISVNDELGMLDRGLDAALRLLRPGGRLIVITFHSLEDRIVKRRFVEWTRDCICPERSPACTCDHRARAQAITRRPLVADAAQVVDNPRSASAKLRAIRRLREAAA